MQCQVTVHSDSPPQFQFAEGGQIEFNLVGYGGGEVGPVSQNWAVNGTLSVLGHDDGVRTTTLYGPDQRALPAMWELMVMATCHRVELVSRQNRPRPNSPDAYQGPQILTKRNGC